jgi:hypothetical protein
MAAGASSGVAPESDGAGIDSGASGVLPAVAWAGISTWLSCVLTDSLAGAAPDDEGTSGAGALSSDTGVPFRGLVTTAIGYRVRREASLPPLDGWP